MKARTKLEYRCDKSQEFDYGMCNWYTRYSRSFDMIVTADTEEECLRAMESFEKAVEKTGFQETFESNLQPEFDTKKNKWVGSVEVYISNEEVEWEKDTVKEIYKNWKESLKNKSENKEIVEMKKREMKIESIYETTYEDGTSWVTYKTPTGETGYEITDEYNNGDEEFLEKAVNEDELTYNGMLDKKDINSCSSELQELIYECLSSENEMWFVEEDEIEEYIIDALAYEVQELGLDEYIKFYEDGCAVTVYGGIITQFLFSEKLENKKSHEVIELTGYDKVLQIKKDDLEKITKEIFDMNVNEFLDEYTFDDVETIQSELYEYYDSETVEFCPQCEEEVVLKAELSIQTCPCCKEKIYACSMCIKQDCSNCPMIKINK